MRSRGLWLVLFFALFFSACTISEEDRKSIHKVIEIRESLLNKGDIIKSYGALLTADFPKKSEYLKQLNMQHFYLSNYSYLIRTVKPGDSQSLGKKSVYTVEYNLTYKLPDDKAETVYLNRVEKLTFKKDDIGWRIAAVEEDKNSGTKIKPDTVYGIYYALDTRKSALLAKDTELFETIISDKYKGRKKLIDNFKKNQEAFSQITYTLKGREMDNISKDRKKVEVIQFYDLGFRIKGKEDLTEVKDQKEIITLEREGEVWKVTAGLN